MYVFDALISKRPYKKPFSVDAAAEIIAKEREKHFDPHLVDLFLANLDGIQKIRESAGGC